MGFNCLKATEPLRGGSLLFTTEFPEIPGTHLIDLGRMKGWVDLRATQWLWTRDLWIGNPAPYTLSHCSPIPTIKIKVKQTNDFQRSPVGHLSFFLFKGVHSLSCAVHLWRCSFLLHCFTYRVVSNQKRIDLWLDK